MLHSYSFSNFRSFLETAHVDFSVTDHVPDTNMVATNCFGQRFNKVCAVIGPNGSGKTNLLSPLAFLGWFMADSFQSEREAGISVEPHFFQESPVSDFSVIFDHDGKVWRYNLSVTRTRVISESLFEKTSRLFSYVFVREWNENSNQYDIKQQNFGLSAKEASKVRENASLISTAAQYGVEQARRLSNISFHSNVNRYGRRSTMDDLARATNVFGDNPDLHDMMNALLSQWDLGLSEVRIDEVDFKNKAGETKKVKVPMGIHRHKEQVAELVLNRESSGTQSAFVHLSRLLPVLRDGGIAVIDEFEADLHPYMLNPILDLFFSPHTNPNNAQLIFTCHSMEILNLLHKSQIMLVEKHDCYSESWRLDSMKGIRQDDNLYAKYMAGAYSAVPNL